MNFQLRQLQQQPVLVRSLCIKPVGATRQSKEHSWANTPQARRTRVYRAYSKEVRSMFASDYELPSPTLLVFWLPMPKSWSKKKKARMLGQPCLSKPDTDNLIKGFTDSIYYQRNDAAVWDVRGQKRWCATEEVGRIDIYQGQEFRPTW